MDKTPQYFAEVIDGIVKRVLVVSQEFINSCKLGDPKNWIETKMDGSINNKYAGKGDEFHKDLDAFISKKPFTSWTLDTVKKEYVAPVEKPIEKAGEMLSWNEKDKKWDKVVLSETLISK